MITFATEKGDGKEFVSHAPGCWEDVEPELWKDWKWQLKNRVTSLAQLEKHLDLSEEERSGVLLSGDKLALAITPRVIVAIAPAAALSVASANRNCIPISRKPFVTSKRTPKCATCC